MNYVAVFFAGFLLDILYTVWIRDVTEGRAWRAAAASMSIGWLGLLGFLSAVVDLRYGAFYVMGLGAGTYVGVKYGNSRKDTS